MRFLTLAIVLLVITQIASAAVDFKLEHPDNSGELVGYVTTDFIFTTSTDWLVAVLWVTPDASGQIYQDAEGTDRSPRSNVVEIFPTLEWDTFLSDGSAIDGGTPSVPSTVFPEIGLNVPPIFDTNEVLISYYTMATNNVGDLMLARVTLANTTQGTWRFMAFAVEGGPAVPVIDVSGEITNGYIPEPTTLTLLALGGLAMLKRRS